MIRRLSTTDELVMAERLRDVFVSGEASLAAEWLARSTARVMVQESGRPLEHEEAPLVAQTFAAAGVEKLFAISIDSLLATPEAYDLATSADNLRQISDEFLWVSFILMDPAAHYCILFTACDLD